MPIRYAIWAAVSSKDQAADDKASLRVQEDECRRVASAKGWQETSGPYIVRGQSRTRWVSLRDAETNVPELHAMLDAAQARQFDVLVVKDYDRFRDILDQVFRTINDYRIQLYSLAQPIEPAPPHSFDPEASDSQELLISFSQLRSRTEIRTTRRRYRAGMPERVTRHGLPVVIPWGYRKPPGRESDRRVTPELDPTLTPYLLAIKDRFLAGQSTRQLAEYLKAQNAPTPGGKPTWHQATVRGLLLNPFYAGIIRWGASKTHPDRRTGRRNRERTPATQSAAITAPGRHLPLWDAATYQSILAEFERRQIRYSGRRANTLSGLLTCGQCSARMWLQYSPAGKDSHDPATITWYCSKRQPGHPTIKNTTALQLIIEQIQTYITTGIPARPATAPVDTSSLQDLYAQRARIEAGYNTGDYTIETMRAYLAPLKPQIAELETTLQKSAVAEHDLQVYDQLMATLATRVDVLPQIINAKDLQTVNSLLKQIIAHVVIIDSDNVSVQFRK